MVSRRAGADAEAATVIPSSPSRCVVLWGPMIRSPSRVTSLACTTRPTAPAGGVTVAPTIVMGLLIVAPARTCSR